MKLISGKHAEVSAELVREAICNAVFKRNPELRNRSKLPEVIIINEGGLASPGAPLVSFSAKVILEKEESDIVKP